MFDVVWWRLMKLKYNHCTSLASDCFLLRVTVKITFHYMNSINKNIQTAFSLNYLMFVTQAVYCGLFTAWLLWKLPLINCWLPILRLRLPLEWSVWLLPLDDAAEQSQMIKARVFLREIIKMNRLQFNMILKIFGIS